MKKIKLILLVPVMLVVFLLTTTNYSFAATEDPLYTQIDKNGTTIDGNAAIVISDKPVIRPSYVGASILNDYTGPTGKFSGFWGEQSSGRTDDYYGQEYAINKPVIIRNVGFHNGQSLALKIDFTRPSTHWMYKVTLTRDGALNVGAADEGVEFRLVYNDGIFNTPVEDVLVELPVLSNPSAYNTSSKKYSTTNIKTSNLVRLVFNEDEPSIVANAVSRKDYTFNDSAANKYVTETLTLEHKFLTSQANTREVKQTVVFDNKEPLVLAQSKALAYQTITTLFKSSMKTPWEIGYLPPRVNGSKNTTKFEANYDITQAVNDGYAQYFPDSLSLVMLDDQNMFNHLNISNLALTDQDGKNIMPYFTAVHTGSHKIEYKISKANLIKLGSNQINMTLSADNLNNAAVLKNYDASEGVYTVPIKFYNYKVFKGKTTESEKMTAVAKITPNIYGEANDGVKADQYTYSGDLDKNALLKNVATTIPGDTLKTEIVDKNIFFDTVKTYNVDVKISSTTSSNEKVISVPVSITKVDPITSAHFENQSWLINEINKQLSPKKIDQDIYKSDLAKIKEIILAPTGQGYQGQKIPKTIDSLANLSILSLKNTKLSGSLPTELGNLTKLKTLQVSGNSLIGGIPASLAKLEVLEFLNLEQNGLTGTVPTGLKDISTLKQVYLGSNQFVGVLPEFSQVLTDFGIENTQLTYNKATLPTFMPNKDSQRVNSFLASSSPLKLGAKAHLPISANGTKIKPFDSANSGFFDLHAVIANETKTELYSGHTLKIINKRTGAVLYNGASVKTAEISVDVGEVYQVIMDNAANNPNNVVEILGKVFEYKIKEVPKKFSLDLKLGDLNNQQVKISGGENLSVYDNRVNSKWQLKLKPSALKSATKTLSGNYIYKPKNGVAMEIPTDGSFKVIESGTSEPASGEINISKDWNDQYGLFYKQSKVGNYKDSYAGKLEWQLADVPS